MAEFDVLAIGELNPDLILSGIRATAPTVGTEQEFDRHQLTLGSSTAITCVLMQRLGLATALSAYVGADEHGDFCRARLTAEGVDTALVRTHPTLPTGVTICLPYPGDRLLLTSKGTMALNPSDAVDDAWLRRTRHLHVGSFFLQDALRPAVAALFARAHAAGVSTSLDTGWDPAGRWLGGDLRAALAATDYLFPNAVEFARLTDDAELSAGLATLHDCGAANVVLKRDAEGSLHSGSDGLVTHPGFRASAVDTTGAGDAFNAGYLAAMLQGAGAAERLAFGNACGALTVAAIGGTGGVADAAQVGAFVTARA